MIRCSAREPILLRTDDSGGQGLWTEVCILGWLEAGGGEMKGWERIVEEVTRRPDYKAGCDSLRCVFCSLLTKGSPFDKVKPMFSSKFGGRHSSLEALGLGNGSGLGDGRGHALAGQVHRYETGVTVHQTSGRPVE